MSWREQKSLETQCSVIFGISSQCSVTEGGKPENRVMKINFYHFTQSVVHMENTKPVYAKKEKELLPDHYYCVMYEFYREILIQFI